MTAKASRPPPPERSPTGYLRIGAQLTANEGEGVRVAVLDTGVDLDHADLAANVARELGTDCVNEPGVAPGDDRNGHGTHVAGTIAAVSNEVGSHGRGA